MREFNENHNNLKQEEPVYITRKEIYGETGRENKPKKKLIKKIFLYLFLIIAVSLLLIGTFFIWKTYKIGKKISSDQKQTSLTNDIHSVVKTFIPSKTELPSSKESGRINILLLGIAGENKPGKNLTDTIMIMSINTKTNSVGLLSLPRDLYVNIPDTSTYTKINGVYQYGIAKNENIDLVKKTIKNITALDVDYYIIANFDGFQKIIDDIGGINIAVQRDIYDARYPGPNYSYETFELKKGFHTLDGATALKYVRERHDDPEGDFGRAKRQQQVIQATRNKVFSMQTLLNVVALNNMLNTLGDNVKTDIPIDRLDSFISLSKKLDMQNITNVVIDAWRPDSLLKVSHVFSQNVRAFILVPRIGNYDEIQEVAKNIFDQKVIEKRLAEISKENASVNIINASDDFTLANKISALLKKLSIKNVTISASNTAKINFSDAGEKTIVIDNSNGTKLYTLDELIKKIPAQLSAQTIETKNIKNTDFTLVLGNDIINNFKYEEDSIEDFNNAQDDQMYLNLLNQ